MFFEHDINIHHKVHSFIAHDHNTPMQIVEGVQHMHKHGMYHRDLKLENIVLDSHYNCKLMDFGHAKHASDMMFVRV